MSDQHIPNELQRQLMLEVGYRCPLCKQTEPLEFEHIEDYADTKCHEFTNMIVLWLAATGASKIPATLGTSIGRACESSNRTSCY